MKSTLALLLLISAISFVTSYKILFFMGFSFKSHRIAFDPVIAELAKRGHEVTVLSSVKAAKEIPGVLELHTVKNGLFIENNKMSFFNGSPGEEDEFMQYFLEMLQTICRNTYEDPNVFKMLNSPKDFNYDVMLVDAIFNECALPLGHHLGTSNIIFSPGIRFASLAWDMNIPHPISYLPNEMDFLSYKMNFWERVKNTFDQVGFHYMRHYRVRNPYDNIIAEFIPDTPTIADLEKNVSLLITNTHSAVNHPMPNMPYSIEVGCLNCEPANPLPKDLEDFLESSGEAGTIYFSLGSITKGDSMPLEMRDKVMEAFAQLPQKILWKYEKDIENLPKNIKLIKWAPQQDLLEHKKIRLFITHGGGLSISEGIYHRCPLLGFPLSADQWSNMATAVERGFAEYLDFRTFTAVQFLNKIKLMLNDDRYQKAAEHYSAILRDHPQPLVEKAAYWIEYVARHKGAAHLKSAAEGLNFFQYFLLDVIGVILLAVFTLITIVYFVIRKVCRMFCSNKSISTKKKTN